MFACCVVSASFVNERAKHHHVFSRPLRTIFSVSRENASKSRGESPRQTAISFQRFVVRLPPVIEVAMMFGS